MAAFDIERRRSPRIDLMPEEAIRLKLQHRVQLLDISLTGAMLACLVKLPLGTQGRFHAGLATLPFTAEVVVKRHQTASGESQPGILGARFSSMDERSRQHLEQFLRKGSD